MVFGTFGVLANPSLEIEDPFRRCSVQKQNTAATSFIKNSVFSKPFSKHSHMSNG
jgi:hypothetical protein